MAIVADLTPTPIPAGDTTGGVTGSMFSHVTVTPAGGAGTYTFSHNLPWTPTAVLVIAQLAEGTAPTATNAAVAWCIADTTATKVAINVGGNATYHVWYV